MQIRVLRQVQHFLLAAQDGRQICQVDGDTPERRDWTVSPRSTIAAALSAHFGDQAYRHRIISQLPDCSCLQDWLRQGEVLEAEYLESGGVYVLGFGPASSGQGERIVGNPRLVVQSKSLLLGIKMIAAALEAEREQGAEGESVLV